jgi:hypothetical protein
MRFLPLLLLLLPTLAFADTKPDTTRLNNRCTTYSLCKLQAATGECVSHRDGDEIVHQVGRFAHYTFYSTTSTDSSYSCDIMTNTTGFDASVADSTQTDQVNTTSITDEAPVYTMAVLLHKLWITCSEWTDGVINIDVDICAME